MTICCVVANSIFKNSPHVNTFEQIYNNPRGSKYLHDNYGSFIEFVVFYFFQNLVQRSFTNIKKTHT